MEKTKADYFFTVFFLLISAKTSFLYEVDMFWFIFSISILSYGFYQRRIYESDLYVFVGFAFAYIGYIVFRNILFNKLDSSYLLSDIYFLLKYIFLAYSYCVVVKKNATSLIAEVVIVLAKISLVLYAFQLAGGGEVLYSIGNAFYRYTLPYPGLNDTFSNFWIFTYDRVHTIRNCGFMWEPGAFGCFLTIALMFHFMNNHFVFDRNAIIVVVAIVTTLSTTAYQAFAILLLVYYRYNGGIISFKMIFIFIIGIYLFMSLPFLGDKIAETYEEDLAMLEDHEGIFNQLNFYEDYGGEVKLNRFSSVKFLYDNFGSKLIFGVSNAYVNLKSKLFDVQISRFNISNGIIDFITKFGLIGFLFALYRIGRFIYLHYLKVEFSIYIVLMILIMNFGSPIFILPMTLLFLFLPKFSVLDEDYEEELEEEEEFDHEMG